jgi:quercetin dioxygenase-like cupin family protein
MKVVAVAAILGVAALLSPFLKQERDKEPQVVKASAVKWEKMDGMPEGFWIAHPTGDPDSAPWVCMVKMSKGTLVPLHSHSPHNVMTVVTGNVEFGREGKPGDGTGMMVGPGGYCRMPANQPHWTYAKDDAVFVVSGDKKNDIHFIEKEKRAK